MKKVILILSLMLLNSHIFAAIQPPWKCYQTVICKKGLCQGIDGVGDFLIKPYLYGQAIPDATYSFTEMSMHQDPPWNMPTCDYIYNNKISVVATANGIFNNNYYENLPKFNKNMQATVVNTPNKYLIIGMSKSYNYTDCGYSVTHSLLNKNTDCIFPAPPKNTTQSTQ